ncbi:outer membrane protein assembly factor BamC [soil metagenome]
MTRFALSHSSLSSAVRVGSLALLASLAGCSTIDRAISGDKVDYQSSVPAKRSTLEVPPDLTQLSVDQRFIVPGNPSAPAPSTVTASTFRPAPGTAAAAAATTAALQGQGTPSVAPAAIGNVQIERSSDMRWLSTTQTPEQLWPQLKTFWTDRGFTLAIDQPEIGLMETDWAENRAKLPNDIIRNTLGKVIDSLYSTGERDRFRTRVERTATGSEVYISHRGMVEVYTSAIQDQTKWQPRPADPQLEAEFLSRLMAKLGQPAATDMAAAAATVAGGASAPAAANVALAPAKARVLTGQPGAALQVDEKFDRAWRGVGLALDRSGFTVEDRDRAQGIYFVRYVDPATAGKDGPGFMSRLFSFGKDKSADFAPARYRVLVKESGNASTVSVQDSSGTPEKGEAGQRIVAMLVEDMK